MPLPLLLISWTHQAQSNPNAPSDLAAAIVGGAIAPEREAPTQHAASIPGTPQVGETLTADIPKVVDAHALNHATLTCHLAMGSGANAGIDENRLDDTTHTHQWAASGADIDGTTGASW